MSNPDPVIEERLAENEAEASLAILRNRVEQHISSVGKTSDRMVGRSQEAVRTIEKLLGQLQSCAEGEGDYDLKIIVSELTAEFTQIKSRLKWHDQQIVAFEPIREAMEEWITPVTGRDANGRDSNGQVVR